MNYYMEIEPLSGSISLRPDLVGFQGRQLGFLVVVTELIAALTHFVL
jgi:hypothetical protein